MPQLMTLNWMYSLFMMSFLLIICYYLYSMNMKMMLRVLNMNKIKNNYNWLW